MSHLMTVVLLCGLLTVFGFGENLVLTLRRPSGSIQGENPEDSGSEVVHWDPSRTAFLVCDMWDKHWCVGASQRVDELAPAMNAVLNAARDQGVLIIHAPSDTMAYYEPTPQRERARSAHSQASPPEDIALWRRLDPAKEPPLPIDDSDGGCDDLPPCTTYGAWSCQHPAIQIAPEDAITDSGLEVFHLLAERQIENVIVMGVHTNMCVLGRSFGIRSLVGQGKRVALMRDMTDSLYNSRKPPFVNHARGTELVIQHIETYWCPSVTSDQIVGGEPFRFQEEADEQSDPNRLH